MTFDFSANGKVTVHSDHTEDWRVTVVDTGLNTMTGGRLKRVKDYISGEPFLMTYGDGVSDVDINECIRFHEETGTMVTLTGVLPEGRFGVMDIDGSMIRSFREKSRDDMGWINGGFMVVEPGALEYIEMTQRPGSVNLLKRLPPGGSFPAISIMVLAVHGHVA